MGSMLVFGLDRLCIPARGVGASTSLAARKAGTEAIVENFRPTGEEFIPPVLPTSSIAGIGEREEQLVLFAAAILRRVDSSFI
jgi:hypothetical protein